MIPYMIRAPATTEGLKKILSIWSSKRTPIMPDGRTAISTFIQRFQVAFLAFGLFLLEKGFSLLKYSINTANIDPNCMTTKKVSINFFEPARCKNWSTKIICPVLLTGNHSVIPCTIPRKIALKISNKNMSSFYEIY